MINRRNIRVKVMQTLYTLAALQPEGEHAASAAGQKILKEKLAQSLDLFTTNVAYLAAVAQYAEVDARMRSSKYLPTESDKNVNTKLAGNEFIWRTLENDTYKERLKSALILEKQDEALVKKLYRKLTESKIYEDYVSEESRNPASEKAIMRFIWTDLMLQNEDYDGFMADEMAGWEDDKETIYIMMDNFFKSPQSLNFLSLLTGEKLEYAQSLLQTAIEKEAFCMELIQPKLINWEAERVAQIDLILLRLGICEFLYFPTIPTKVTINEYIEIAKQYSTPQSGHFVNAVLDKLLKDFEQQQKIKKQDRNVH